MKEFFQNRRIKFVTLRHPTEIPMPNCKFIVVFVENNLSTIITNINTSCKNEAGMHLESYRGSVVYGQANWKAIQTLNIA